MVISILITGGTGFVGSAIVDAVTEKHPEWSVSVLDLQSPSQTKGNIHYEVADITIAAETKRVFESVRPVAVIHSAGLVPELASRYNRRAQERVFDVNVNGTRNVLAAARKTGVRALVWTGSCTAVTDDARFDYPNIDESWPTSSHSLIYGESKAAAEALVLAANDEKFSTCALRPSVIFGPGDNQLMPSLYACIAKGETPYIIGSGLNMWDVTYISNVADAHVLAVENLLSARTAAGEAIFISNEQPVPFRDFCLAVWREFGHYPPFEVHIPKIVATFAGLIADWVSWFSGTATTLSKGSVQDACATRYFSGRKAQRILGYVANIGIEEGITRSCEEYKRRCKLANENALPESVSKVE